MKAMRIFVLLGALACAVLFSSCSNEDEIPNNEERPVSFTSSIAGQALQQNVPGTRVTAGPWAEGAQIGVFMVNHGQTTVALNAANKKFTTALGDGNFSAVTDNHIYFPASSNVDFIAYYPYREDVTLSTPISLGIGTTQTASNQQEADLLWAATSRTVAAGYNKSSGLVALAFAHMYSKLVLNCKGDSSVGDSFTTGMTVTIKGMYTTNTFNFSTGTLSAPADVANIIPRALASAPEGFAASYDAIIVPAAYLVNTVTVEFAVDGDTFIWNVPATTFEGGKQYTYGITLKRTGVGSTGTITDWDTTTTVGIGEAV